MQDFQQGLKRASQGEVMITKAKETGEVGAVLLQNFQEPMHWKIIYVIANFSFLKLQRVARKQYT